MKTKITKHILRAALLAVGVAALTSTALSYGPEGHETVGAIADILIANSPNTVAHVRQLIGNDTLQHAATWADRCKTDHPTEAAMIAFVNANPHQANSNGPHDHFAYHYTDIPIQETHYRAGSAGAKPIDVVHMLRNCISILEGQSNATNNPTHITKDTALRLVVHYMGDIHQPLHVGAAYFGPNAQLVNPNSDPTARPDLGGNNINFSGGSLHHYWDTVAVQNAMSAAHVTTPRTFARAIVNSPPTNVDLGPFISGWSVRCANEVMPIATQAHNKLSIHVDGHKWKAADPAGYDAWAAAQVRTEIGRGGFRLAALLKKIWP